MLYVMLEIQINGNPFSLLLPSTTYVEMSWQRREIGGEIWTKKIGIQVLKKCLKADWDDRLAFSNQKKKSCLAD